MAKNCGFFNKSIFWFTVVFFASHLKYVYTYIKDFFVCSSLKRFWSLNAWCGYARNVKIEYWATGNKTCIVLFYIVYSPSERTSLPCSIHLSIHPSRAYSMVTSLWPDQVCYVLYGLFTPILLRACFWSQSPIRLLLIDDWIWCGLAQIA